MTDIMLMINDRKVMVAKSELSDVLAEFEVDELAELLQYRYATPWNHGKDILEKLLYILEDILYIYSKDPDLPKEEVVRDVKLRINAKVNK
ncbi:hypothetical protein A3L04_00425 [Thermococcus chitonophagus]|uniref:Uncharacterized protein n=1 Tax=Thermococcus chitonophagus TaxID=54262 RepID=A0A160VRA9_9EURY|nr:hypothetical protein [Thermococcus chitonophagus]ASJ15647.1 hypothetical protein A3L04_00425 [Thermococcus chitonophagus]CUX76856.1 hypothetical protein CHITON_0077 [Thermococcus chitonophagus]